MASRKRIVTDNIHGDIELTADEWKVVNTATFQRLRSLKQLGMGHLVYPNATHTRFAHSLGVFRIMCRVLEKLGTDQLASQIPDLRLAALLHDLGHYPYSHLMEGVDAVSLTEEQVATSRAGTISGAGDPFPNHEELGRHILETQPDICKAVGGKSRARKIGAMFSRLEGSDAQLTKLIHSSLDMDRLDYLLRDARATGVPYGVIDLDYLLNNIVISPGKVLGVTIKALAAAEHFLLSRAFMYRVVYFHKTTYGFEEACRQLLRRVRDSNRYKTYMPATGTDIRALCGDNRLRGFTDEFLDRIVFHASDDKADPVIAALAACLATRQPPKLLGEVAGLVGKGEHDTAEKRFRKRCLAELPTLAKKHGLQLGQFLSCGPKPIKFEERGPLMTVQEAKKLKAEEREELIKIIPSDGVEPVSIVDIPDSMIRLLAGQVHVIQRLYVAAPDLTESKLEKMRATVREWM